MLRLPCVPLPWYERSLSIETSIHSPTPGSTDPGSLQSTTGTNRHYLRRLSLPGFRNNGHPTLECCPELEPIAAILSRPLSTVAYHRENSGYSLPTFASRWLGPGPNHQGRPPTRGAFLGRNESDMYSGKGMLASFSNRFFKALKTEETQASGKVPMVGRYDHTISYEGI